VRDVDNPDSFGFQLCDPGQQQLNLPVRQGRGRLIQRQYPAVRRCPPAGHTGRQPCSNLNHLLLSDAQKPDRHIGLHVLQTHSPHHVPCGTVQLFIVNKSQPAGQPLDKDVLGHSKVWNQIQLLADRLDAVHFGIGFAARLVCLSLEVHPARVRTLQAGDNVHQCALAGAVLADEGMDLSFFEVKVNGAERLNARK
jgi:hypothetical protein